MEYEASDQYQIFFWGLPLVIYVVLLEHLLAEPSPSPPFPPLWPSFLVFRQFPLKLWTNHALLFCAIFNTLVKATDIECL